MIRCRLPARRFCGEKVRARHGGRQADGARLADLRGCTLLSAQTRPDAWADWAAARRARIDPSACRPFEHTYFMLEAAASGLGVGIASHPLVEQDLRAGRLVAPFGFVPSGRAYCVLHARANAANPKVAAFRTWITAAGRDAGAPAARA
jgi:DNA-binding transcriptional LysR family regulator